MFRNVLKKFVIPITILALILVVGISLFFKENSAYEKKTIVNTNKTKEAKKITTKGDGCKERFNSLGFNVTIEKQDNGKITFTISSSTKSNGYSDFLKESGYSGSITYKYVIQQKKDGKFETIKTDVVTIDKDKFTSKVVSDEYSSKHEYKISIYSQDWIRDEECKGTLGVDPGFCTCKSEDTYIEYEFERKNLSGLAEFQLTSSTFEYDGDVEIETGTHTPTGQSETDHVNNYNVGSECKLPDNAQANKYLLPNTSINPGDRDSSATFKKYSEEFDNAPADKKELVNVTDNSVNKVINLSCDYNLDINDIKAVANNDNIAYSGSKINYYKYDSSNTHYYKGVKTEKHQVPDYVWHTELGKTTDNSDNYCTRTCTEIVKVEYGAPVYVSAGMCFQYRMKVSSIVQCEYDSSHMKVPYKKATICQPIAYCIHGDYTSYGAGGNTQAGPNEDFEQCINKCDGGKYTSECSNVCYNLVYENKNSNNLVLSNNRIPSKTSSAQDLKTFFYYSNGIHFYNPDATNSAPVGTLLGYSLGTATGYSMKGYEIYRGSSDIYMIDEGIPRANYGYDTCHETCGWIPAKKGCDDPHEYYFEGDTYNGKYGENVFKKDRADNVKLYNSTLNECKAKATCVQSTATYTIKTKYVEAGESKLQVSEAEFPWTAPHETQTKSDPVSINSCVLSMRDRSPVISFGGCYVNSTAERWYQSEMTFPGVYLDYKHNTINIGNKHLDTDILLPGRMCVNSYQGNTNAVWAARFDDAIGKLSKDSSYTINNVGDYWSNSFSEKAYGSDMNSVEGYNIKGIIKKFGYFKWNFNISCFYALYVPCENGDETLIECSSDCYSTTTTTTHTSPSTHCYRPDDSNATKPECQNPLCSSKDSYTVRSFNAADPLATNTTNTTNRESDDIQYKETEIRGYNWTSDATLTKMKNGYNNDPEKLIEDIIENQNTIFDNNVNKPNYVIVLDKDTIRNIKNHNKNDGANPYSTFNDKNNIDSSRVNAAGVYFYYSDFLHNRSIFTSGLNDIPSTPGDLNYQCNIVAGDRSKCKILTGGE